jgi:hypothetical protein
VRARALLWSLLWSLMRALMRTLTGQARGVAFASKSRATRRFSARSRMPEALSSELMRWRRRCDLHE